MSSTTMRAPTSTRPLICTVTALVGVVFLVVGVAGFIPGLTTNFGDMSFAGESSDAKLIGLFEVSVLHNIVHLLYGVVGLLAARTAANSRKYLIGGGVVYLVLWVYGVLVDQGSSANFVPLNSADNWLHLILGLGMVALGLALPRATRNERSTS